MCGGGGFGVVARNAKVPGAVASRHPHPLLSTSTETTSATVDRMRLRHRQAEAALDGADGELSTGRALFYFLFSISEAAKPL